MIKNIKNTFKTVNRFWNNLFLLFDKRILQHLYNIHNIYLGKSNLVIIKIIKIIKCIILRQQINYGAHWLWFVIL